MTTDEKNLVPDNLTRRIISEPKYMNESDDPLALVFTGEEQMENEIRLECATFDCRMKIRQSVKRPSNFSVILIYKDANRNDHVILRLNGDHGKHTNRLEKTVVYGPHIHILTERYQQRTNHPDGYAEATDRYSDLAGAIETFMDIANISFIEKRSNATQGN